MMEKTRKTITIPLPPYLKSKDQDVIEKRLLQSLASGKSSLLTKKDFDDIKSEVRKRAFSRNR